MSQSLEVWFTSQGEGIWHCLERSSKSPTTIFWTPSLPRSSRRAIFRFKGTCAIFSAPTRSSVYTDSEVVAKYRWYPIQLKALEASKVRPRLPEWLEMDVKIGTYLNLALVGDRTPEEALNELNAEIADILGK